MRTRVIHVLTFEGCPHAEAAKEAARVALSRYDREVDLVDVDLLDPTIPAAYRKYPSPTILVGMKEVSPAGGTTDGLGCRAAGAPSVDDIGRAIEARWGRTY